MKKIFKHISRMIRIPINRFLALRKLQQFHSQCRSLSEIVDWALNFPSSGFFKVSTIQVRSEIMSLASAVEELNPRTILEIGTARGGTLFIWANLASSRVISCDLEDAGIRRELYSAFASPASGREVVHLSGNSHEAAFKESVEKELNGEQVDFLFIDGDHTEAGVEQDYNDYHHLVRPGGLIAFHDIIEKQAIPTNQVYFFWKRLKENADTEEFINDPEQCGYGIGIVRVPG